MLPFTECLEDYIEHPSARPVVERHQGTLDRSYLFRHVRPLHAQPDGVEALTRRDEQRLVVLPSERDVGGPVLGDVNLFDRSAFAGSTTLVNQMIPILTDLVGVPLAPESAGAFPLATT